MTVSEPFMTCHKSPAYSMFPLAWNDWQNNVMGFLKAAVCDGPVGVVTVHSIFARAETLLDWTSKRPLELGHGLRFP